MDASHAVWTQLFFAPTDVNSHKNGSTLMYIATHFVNMVEYGRLTQKW